MINFFFEAFNRYKKLVLLLLTKMYIFLSLVIFNDLLFLDKSLDGRNKYYFYF